MTSFGSPTTATPAPVSPPSSSSSLSLLAHIGLAAFALGAASAAAYVWFFVLKVPLERPVEPLFGGSRIPREGWAAWYLAPLTAFALTYTLYGLYFRKPHRWTVLGLALAGAIALLLGSTAAFWVKNIGYTWYSVPNANILAILSALPPMFAFAFGRGAHVMIELAPLSLATGAVLGTIWALLMDLPWSHRGHIKGATCVSTASLTAVPIAGRLARIVSTALMTIFVTTVAVAGMPSLGIEVAPFVALIWWFVSFRKGRYDFFNVVIGSALLGAISTVPFFFVLASVTYTFDPSVMALGVVTRTPVYVLVSFIVIKITLVMSKATRVALARLQPAGNS